MQPAWLAIPAAAAWLVWSGPVAGYGTRLRGQPAFRIRYAAPVITPVAPDTLVGRRARPEVDRLAFQGTHAISPGEIEKSIVTTASHCRALLLTPFCWFSKAPYFYKRYYLDRDELKRDVIRIRVLYWLRGYRLASVDTSIKPPRGTHADVTFSIHEGPVTRVTAVTVTPDTLFSPRVLARLVQLHKGDPLDLIKLDTTVKQLRQHLWARGDADAVVDTAVRLTGQPPDDSVSRAAAAAGLLAAGAATVTITLAPGRRAVVDTVIVTGNQRVSAQTIEQTIPLRPRSVFYRGDVESSQRVLFQTNLFRSAAVRVDTMPGKPDSLKQVVVNVVEGPHREVSATAGFTTAAFFSLTGRFTNYDWFGEGRVLTLTGSIGNLGAPALYSAFNNGFKLLPEGVSPSAFLSPTWIASADVTQTNFLAVENSLGLSVFAHRRLAPGVFIDNGQGASITFTHDLAQRAPLSLTYRYEVSHVEAGDAYFCVDYGVCDEATRDALLTRSRRSPVILQASINRSNDPLNPSAGFILHGEAEYASQYTASDFLYDRAYVWGSLFRPIARTVLAFHASAGFVTPLGTGAVGDTTGRVLHPATRFYAGGSQSVRGFGENGLGPLVLTIPPNVLRGSENQCPESTPITECPVNKVSYLTDADFNPQPLGGRTILEGSVEFRFPIARDFGGAVFVDGAIVGQGDLQQATSGQSAITPGLGVRYYSVIGPIRLDIGLNPLTTYHLEVLTETPTGSIVQVTGPPGTSSSEALRTYSPARTLPGLDGLLNRVAIHLALGQAF